jgi:hypothetical protein
MGESHSKQSHSTGMGTAAVVAGELVLKKVTLYLSKLHNEEFLMNFLVGVENFFTSGMGDRTFESWWTHFAMELTFEDGPKRILERSDDGVLFECSRDWSR